jgi:cytochrome P450
LYIFRPDEDYYRFFHELNGIPSSRDIYSEYSALGRSASMVEEEPSGPSQRRWTVFGYDAAAGILRNDDVFSGKIIVPNVWLALGTSLIHLDGEEHAQLRRAARPLFSPARLRRWEHSVVRPAAHALLDRIVARGRADLVGDFAAVLPHIVLARLMGFSDEDMENARRWAVQILCAGHDLATGMRASSGLTRCLQRVLAARREAPADDLSTDVLHLEVGGRPLGEEAQLSFLRMLTPGGFETTFRALANLLTGLLAEPAQLAALREDPSLIPQAVEEGLRWETSILRTARIALCDTVVDGVSLPAGARVEVHLAAANHDERVFAGPERFNLFRPAVPHLAFSLGQRHCLGAALARMELRVALEALLERLPGLALDPAAEPPVIGGHLFRSALRLPVVFDT